jgi:2,3-bisphosphoglycerate-dependent phosphoglycerate mutase
VKKIYFIRHAESENDAGKRLAGHTDFALTDKGRQQALDLVTALPHGLAVYSPLKRAKDTAKHFSDKVQSELLIERKWGQFEARGRDEFSEVEKKIMRAMRGPIGSDEDKIFSDLVGAESRQSVFDRMRKHLNGSLAGDHKVTLCFSHGHAIATLLEGMTGFQIPIIGHCGYVELQFGDDNSLLGMRLHTNRAISSDG